ncbi:MAG TPA: NAD-dependent epimerase/dehydratase family protein [Patescibacteria group bacterium]|nr:NAD-dependent epimerase/dehydratase family protein [Patescibacteria group bacterium]
MIIITGATGFVGKRFIKLAVKKYGVKNILCLIKDANGPLEIEGRKLLKEMEVKTKYINLVTKKGLKNLPKSPEVIINLAAITDTAVTDHRCNDVGVENLLNTFGKLGPNTHFVHFGTMVAWSGRINCSKPFSKYSPMSPTNEYTRSKVRGENILVERQKIDGFKLSILKPNTIYGSGMRPDSLFDFLSGLIQKKSIFARLNWPGLSSLIHVDNVAQSIISTISNPPSVYSNKIYLLHGEHLTLAQMSKFMHKEIGVDYKSINLPKLFWSICKTGRLFIPMFELVTSLKIYNLIWRAGIITDNVIYCKSNDMIFLLNGRQTKKLKNHIKEVLK